MVYILTPLLMILIGCMYTAAILRSVEDKKPALMFSPEERTLLILRSQFLEDKLTLDQFEVAIERALNGAGFMQATEGMELPTNSRIPLPQMLYYQKCYEKKRDLNKGPSL